MIQQKVQEIDYKVNLWTLKKFFTFYFFPPHSAMKKKNKPLNKHRAKERAC